MRDKIVDKIEKLKSKITSTVRNRNKSLEFIKINNSYLIEERIQLSKKVKRDAVKYELILNDLVILEGERKQTKKYFILPKTKFEGDFIYLDNLYKRIERHNKKVLEDQIFNNIETFISS